MIAGIILRYCKTYKGRNYIPLTDEDQFCGIVGNNGVGKSTILEALDVVFNDRHWNYNTAVKKSGFTTTEPEIVPIFILLKSSIPDDLQQIAQILSDYALSIDEENKTVTDFIKHRDRLNSRLDLSDSYLLPIGIDYENKVSLSFFYSKKFIKFYLESTGNNADNQSVSDIYKTPGNDVLKTYSKLLENILRTIDYIYIPVEIDSELFTRLETKEIQVLMGETLNEIVSSIVPSAKIKEINDNLNSFLEQISAELEDYSYRTPTDRQQNLKKADLYNLIIQAFFNIRKLHKYQNGSWLEINSLSSGEKQKAIIDIAYSLISEHRESGENLIIGVDEPESSLHMSACFDQFDSLHRISRGCMQLIFSTHWYGFLPATESGSATFISVINDSHKFEQLNLANYREQIRQDRTSTSSELPYDVRLKSINDFVQSVISSSMSQQPYNWLICEGSSEKVYLSHYLKDLVEDGRLRIVPVGGAKQIKKLYQHLAIICDELKNDLKGKIFLLSDTDENLVNYDVINYPNLKCLRLVNVKHDKSTNLIKIQSNPQAPATEVEDTLNGKAFFKTLYSYEERYPSILSFLDNYDVEDASENCSAFSLDLRSSEWDAIEEFFNSDNNKYDFSVNYCKEIERNTYVVPKWIEEIREYFNNSGS